jgi:hypothetical protein
LWQHGIAHAAAYTILEFLSFLLSLKKVRKHENNNCVSVTAHTCRSCVHYQFHPQVPILHAHEHPHTRTRTHTRTHTHARTIHTTPTRCNKLSVQSPPVCVCVSVCLSVCLCACGQVTPTTQRP